MNLIEKLSAVQCELKAPKSQTNDFGKYKYRSCEDILEALKPLLKKVSAAITITDDVAMIGNRFYVKATATFFDTESECDISCSAYAREEDNKKGMDESQVTGKASSYARKYALNGLFCIDDTKDADALNDSISKTQIDDLNKRIAQKGINKEIIKKMFKVSGLEELKASQYEWVCEHLDEIAEKLNANKRKTQRNQP